MKIVRFLIQRDDSGIDDVPVPVILEFFLDLTSLNNLPFELRSESLYGVRTDVVGSHAFGTWMIVPTFWCF